MNTLQSRLYRRGPLVILALALALTLLLAVTGQAGRGGSWKATEFQIQNLDDEPALITARFYDPAGVEVLTFNDTISPGMSAYYRPEFTHGLPETFTGTLVVTSAQNIAGAVVHFASPAPAHYNGVTVYEMFDEAELKSNAYAPLVEKDHEGFDSRIGVSNMSDVAATVAITIHDPAGDVVSTWSEQMTPRGLVELNVGDIATLPGGFVGSASIQAEQPILVQVSRSNEMALASYTALAQGDSELAAPLVAGALPGVITSSVALQNTGRQPTVVAEAYGAGCDTCLCRVVALAPGSSDFVTRPYTTSIPLYIFNDDESPVASVVTLDSLQPGEAGSATYAAFEVARLGNRSAVPLALGGYEGWYTQVWVQNLGTTTTTAYLTYTLLTTPGTSSILPAVSAEVGPRQTVMFSPPPSAHASAIAWADQPIAVLISGHNDSLTLEDSLFIYRGTPYGPPLARFSDDGPVELGDTIYFENSSVAVPPVRYRWDFGDGSVGAQVNPAHTYSASGAYTVTLTATNLYGAATFSGVVEVYGPPQASFESASPTNLGQPSYFVNTSIGLPAPHSYEWDFGDGSSSYAKNPVHYFESAGRHWIILTTYNALGSDTFIGWVDVWDTQYMYLPLIMRSGS